MVSGCEGHISGYEGHCTIGMRGMPYRDARANHYRDTRDGYRDAKAQITGYEGRGIGMRGMRKLRRTRYLVARKALTALHSPH